MALQSTTALATVTLQAASSTVTFSGIPNTYRDLLLIVNVPETVGASTTYLRFNDDSGSNYTVVRLRGNGSAADGYSATIEGAILFWDPPLDCMATAKIFDYSANDKHKTVLLKDSIPANRFDIQTARWANSNPITSLSAETGAGTFSAGSTFSLFGRIG